MKISIIAIFYNSSSYLEKCVNSILNQQEVELELIAIDDCSTDNTAELLDKYAQSDDRVSIFRHSVNKGIAAARNTGISAATGDCFYLIDGDDYLPQNALATLQKYFSKDVDWVQGGYEIRNEADKKIGCRSHPSAIYATREDIMRHFFEIEFIWTHNRLINIKYKDFKFPIGLVHEDQFWNISVYPFISHIVCVDEITYCYISRAKSFSKSSSFRKPFIEDGLLLMEKMMLLDNNWKIAAQSMATSTIVKNIYIGRFSSEYRKKVIRRICDLKIFPISIDINSYPRFPKCLYRLLKYPDWIRKCFADIYVFYMRLFNKPVL